MKYFFVFIIIFFIIFYFNSTDNSLMENFEVRQCFTEKMEPSEKDCLYKLVRLISNILEKHKIDWMPVGGSLLAIHRHQKIKIPWDDDYDMVLSEQQEKRGLEILENELPKYGAQIIKFRTWLGGHLYKISWNRDGIYKNIVYPHHTNVQGNECKYCWPFVDLFVGINKGKKRLFSAYAIKPEEYPLKKITIEGMNFQVPTNGFRTYEKFNKDSCMKIALEQEYSHKREKSEKCIGPKYLNLYD